jgi:hypothetical protein
VTDQLRELGLQINLRKSKIYSPTPLPPDSSRMAMDMQISIVPSLSGTPVAGVPIGTPWHMNWYCINNDEEGGIDR